MIIIGIGGGDGIVSIVMPYAELNVSVSSEADSTSSKRLSA